MRSFRFVPILIGLFLFFGCEDAITCIFPKVPELYSNGFPIGSTETYYYADVSAEISNEPDDDAYDYFFEVEEPLPPGLDYYINYRTISIEGTPLVSGVYEVTIYLYVEGPFDEDTVQLCENSIAMTYTVIIE